MPAKSSKLCRARPRLLAARTARGMPTQARRASEGVRSIAAVGPTPSLALRACIYSVNPRKKAGGPTALAEGRLTGRAKEIARSLERGSRQPVRVVLVAAGRLGVAARRLAAARLAARFALAAGEQAAAHVAEAAAMGLAARRRFAAAWLGVAAGRLGLAAGLLTAARLAARLALAAGEHAAAHVAEAAAAGPAAGVRLAAARLGVATGWGRVATRRLTTAWLAAAAARTTAEHTVKHLERLGFGRRREHPQSGQRGQGQDNTRFHGEGSCTGHTNEGK